MGWGEGRGCMEWGIWVRYAIDKYICIFKGLKGVPPTPSIPKSTISKYKAKCDHEAQSLYTPTVRVGGNNGTLFSAPLQVDHNNSWIWFSECIQICTICVQPGNVCGCEGYIVPYLVPWTVLFGQPSQTGMIVAKNEKSLTAREARTQSQPLGINHIYTMQQQKS